MTRHDPLIHLLHMRDEECSDVPWDAVIGVRERILASEGYRNDDLVWKTICALPELLPALEDAIEDLQTVENRTEDLPIT